MQVPCHSRLDIEMTCSETSSSTASRRLQECHIRGSDLALEGNIDKLEHS